MPLSDGQHDPPSHDSQLDRAAEVAAGIRLRVLGHVLAADGGYMSQACSAAELLAVLYTGAVKLAPATTPAMPPPFSAVLGAGVDYLRGGYVHGNPAPDLDRLLVSPAHYALVVYAALIETGRLAEAALDDFNRDGSTMEMIGAEHSPGFDTTAGSLAQALSQAGGMALGRRIKEKPAAPGCS